ncbi:MAG: hypothetical protein PVF17_12350 [Ignavibacteria bacterium]|jgi:hypothetical protein
MIKLPSDVVIEKIPIEVMYRGVLNGLLTRTKLLYEAIFSQFGDNGLELIRKVSDECGKNIAQRVRCNDEAWNIKKVGLFLVKVFNNMLSEGEVTEFDNKKIAIKVPRCPYPFTSTEICAAHTAMECALVKGLNPALKYKIEKSVPAGDSYCLHVIEQ